MLLPKRVKYRRVQRGRMTGKATRGNVVCQGQYGLVALEPAWISSKQIEAARVAMTRYIKRGGKVWIKIFPDKPVTEKPAETRMGSGKGSPEYWVAVVKPGRVMFELADVDEATAREALRLAMHKLISLLHEERADILYNRLFQFVFGMFFRKAHKVECIFVFQGKYVLVLYLLRQGHVEVALTEQIIFVGLCFYLVDKYIFRPAVFLG